ncbi:hypothetical protein AB0H28_02200 [Micromonospora sp. NPDC050980]|uniref:hypothetical protein n=1 Tax=Micromonospora sp. NPDC050980 TaxID=3155161 RepID=UPI00340CEA27
MAGLIVEVHVPLVPATGLAADAYPFPWIDDVETFLAELEGTIDVLDEGEECGDVYVFAVGGADEADEIGQGRRVELGVS